MNMAMCKSKHVCACGRHMKEAEVTIEWPCSCSLKPTPLNTGPGTCDSLWQLVSVWGPVAGMNFVKQISADRNWHVPSFRGDGHKKSSLGAFQKTHVNLGSIDWLFWLKFKQLLWFFPRQNLSVVRIKNSYFHIRWAEPLTPGLLWTVIVLK